MGSELTLGMIRDRFSTIAPQNYLSITEYLRKMIRVRCSMIAYLPIQIDPDLRHIKIPPRSFGNALPFQMDGGLSPTMTPFPISLAAVFFHPHIMALKHSRSQLQCSTIALPPVPVHMAFLQRMIQSRNSTSATLRIRTCPG